MTSSYKFALVLGVFGICAAGAIFHYVWRPDLRAVRPKDLYSVVYSQLQAFQRADYSGAYGHAASGIQQRFTLVQFESMVRTRYAPLARAREVEFGSFSIQNRKAYLQVFFLNNGGVVSPCVYTLILEQGEWRIEGVERMPEWPEGRRLSGVRA